MHPEALGSLLAWGRLIEKGTFGDFAGLRKTFNSVDRVGKFHVFNIAGNRYRIIAAIHFNTQTLYIRHVLTHREYDQWRP
jgi:mRNA interferase HigB